MNSLEALSIFFPNADMVSKNSWKLYTGIRLETMHSHGILTKEVV